MAAGRAPRHNKAYRPRSFAVKTTSRLSAFVAALICTCVAHAQTAATADPGAPPSPRLRSANGIEYFNGGAGEEARAAIAAQSTDFALRIVFSVAGGAYALADHVDIARGGEKVL